jgi:hypothetical protein
MKLSELMRYVLMKKKMQNRVNLKESGINSYIIMEKLRHGMFILISQ